MFPACKSYDCMQTQVKAQESHAPITREQIKLPPSLLLESLCYKPVARSFQQRQRCLLKWPCEPPAKLVGSNKQSLQSSARHIASKPFSAHLIALAGLFDISCLSPATFSSAVPGDCPVTTDDKVNLFYTNYSWCFSHPRGEQWLFPSQELCWVSGICTVCHVPRRWCKPVWLPEHLSAADPSAVGLVLRILRDKQQPSVTLCLLKYLFDCYSANSVLKTIWVMGESQGHDLFFDTGHIHGFCLAGFSLKVL